MNKKKVIIYSSFLLCWIIHLLLFLNFVIIDNFECNYLYFAIGDPYLFVLSVICTIIVPTVLGISGILSIRIKRKVLSIALIVVCFALLFLTIAFSFVLNGLTRGGITSHTEDLKHYGHYDHFVEKSIKKYGCTDFLPPVDLLSNDSHYVYDYDSGAFSESYKIHLQASFYSQQIYQQQAKHIADLTHYRDNTYYKYSPDEKFCQIIILDDEKQSIQYILTYGVGDRFLEKVSSTG